MTEYLDPRFDPLTKGKFPVCTELPCRWWKGKYGIYECFFGSCLYSEEERKDPVIKYNSVETRFYEFLKGRS